MVAEILGEHAPKVASLTLVPGVGGAYEVSVDGQLVFSKKQLGRFPEPEEVAAIKAKL